ncbi:hypothetical protein TrRE_jg8723 [Triparma retinervis]|uniref:Uncharacterized protein n=1 Tax=Triparma retinervis TaxID=2557542 RepID=A0A9W7A1N9_9STRA|nr:hypothetical protein TrRE_jg8723 [Triparma retinervis]
MKFAALTALLLAGSSQAAPPVIFEDLLPLLPSFSNSTGPINVPSSTTGSGFGICDSLADFTPDYCECADNDGGAKFQCTVDMQGYDTVQLTMEMNLCEQPASVSFDLVDANGIEFSESFASGDSGVAPTGIMVGVPAVGDAEVLLSYAISGDLEELQLTFGFDLGVTILGYQNLCSDYYPDKCPVTFLDTTLELDPEGCA